MVFISRGVSLNGGLGFYKTNRVLQRDLNSTAPAYGISEVWILKLALVRSLIETSEECKFQTSHSADPIRWCVQGDGARGSACLVFVGNGMGWY